MKRADLIAAVAAAPSEQRVRAFVTAQPAAPKPVAYPRSVARAIEQPALKRERKNTRGRAQPSLKTAERATLPHAPCGRCGARAWCNHRQPDPHEGFGNPITDHHLKGA